LTSNPNLSDPPARDRGGLPTTGGQLGPALVTNGTKHFPDSDRRDPLADRREPVSANGGIRIKPMMVGLKRISTAFGIFAATTAAAQAQGVVPSGNANQATANAVAASLKTSPALAGYRIEIETRNGVVSLIGSVATPAQKAEALARARMVQGVTGVSDQLAVTGDSPVRRVQYQTAMHGRFGSQNGGNVVSDGVPVGAPTTAMASGPGMDGGPMPEGAAGMPGGTNSGTPGMPNYSWPSYAPYPNYSAVGYPTAYPWQAWPNIAAPYPYPEVPLDWRAVTLRWDDGIWWLDFKKNYTRPFFTPYPFGIFAY